MHPRHKYFESYRKKNLEKVRAIKNRYNAALRIAALKIYSRGKMKCACCPESHIEFLALDHIEENGAEHRREIKKSNIFQWLKLHNYPKGFQVLCHNCNYAKAFYGVCPHKELSTSNTTTLVDNKTGRV